MSHENKLFDKECFRHKTDYQTLWNLITTLCYPDFLSFLAKI